MPEKGAVDVGPTDRLSVDQTMQQVQHVGLGCDALCQGHFHGDPHGLFIMPEACLRHDVMQNQCQDINHSLPPLGITLCVTLSGNGTGQCGAMSREGPYPHQACAA
jgi:hypothetical protein